MEVTSVMDLLSAADERSPELLRLLEQHLASLEEQLESVIKVASGLPVDQQDKYWALAADLQKEIRLTRKHILAELDKQRE